MIINIHHSEYTDEEIIEQEFDMYDGYDVEREEIIADYAERFRDSQ